MFPYIINIVINLFVPPCVTSCPPVIFGAYYKKIQLFIFFTIWLIERLFLIVLVLFSFFLCPSRASCISWIFRHFKFDHAVYLSNSFMIMTKKNPSQHLVFLPEVKVTSSDPCVWTEQKKNQCLFDIKTNFRKIFGPLSSLFNARPAKKSAIMSNISINFFFPFFYKEPQLLPCATLSERGKQAIRFISGEKEERMEGAKGRVWGREMCALSWAIYLAGAEG